MNGIVQIKGASNSPVLSEQETECLTNPNISLTAKGVLCYLFSSTEKVFLGSIDDLVINLLNHGTEGEKAIRAALIELQSHGYIAPCFLEDHHA